MDAVTAKAEVMAALPEAAVVAMAAARHPRRSSLSLKIDLNIALRGNLFDRDF